MASGGVALDKSGRTLARALTLSINLTLAVTISAHTPVFCRSNLQSGITKSPGLAWTKGNFGFLSRFGPSPPPADDAAAERRLRALSARRRRMDDGNGTGTGGGEELGEEMQALIEQLITLVRLYSLTISTYSLTHDLPTD